MTTLLTNQLYNNVGVSQKIRLYNSIKLKGLRVQIYKAGALVDGTLTCYIYKDSTLLDQSSLTYSQLNSISSEYWQGHILFDFDPISFISIDKTKNEGYEEIEFLFKIENYTDSDTNHIDLVRNYEALEDVTEYKRVPLYNETGDGLTTTYDNSMPISVELYLLG